VIAEESLKDRYDCVLLAQLSMSAFLFSYPDSDETFGLPILTSGEYGFRRLRHLLLGEA
jgi:hypothetical protein